MIIETYEVKLDSVTLRPRALRHKSGEFVVATCMDISCGKARRWTNEASFKDWMVATQNFPIKILH
jgi:hypothetical protein